MNLNERIAELESTPAESELILSECHDLLIALARYHKRMKDLGIELIQAANEYEKDSKQYDSCSKRAERHLDQAAAIRWIVKSVPSLIQRTFGQPLEIEEIASEAAVDEDCALLDSIAMQKYNRSSRLEIIDKLNGISRLGIATGKYKEKRLADAKHLENG